jgi:hypothetical protein
VGRGAAIQENDRIVESWIALEFDAKDVRNPEFWRASSNAASCEVVEYSGDWGAPLRRAFCGTRVPFRDSYPVAKLLPLTDGVPFAWARDKRGFVVPEIRVDPATVQWLKAHVPNKFMHQRWPANTALDWLRLELDLPVDAAIAGWTAPPPILPLSFDPARPAGALPTGIVQKRLDQGTSWPAMVVGFGIGLYVWFKGMALMPLISGMTPVGRWILSALPLLTLPWWMEGLPHALAYFSRDTAYLVREVFADIARADRLVAWEPEQATLANGERLVWRFDESVYADTIGRFKFAQPNPPSASEKAAAAAFTETITVRRARSTMWRAPNCSPISCITGTPVSKRGSTSSCPRRERRRPIRRPVPPPTNRPHASSKNGGSRWIRRRGLIRVG